MKNGYGIIFDLDGLMIDSERLINKAVVAGGKIMGLCGIEEISLRTIGTSRELTRRIYEDAYGKDFGFDRLMELKHLYLRKWLGDSGFAPKPGLKALLERVTSKGYSIAVGSSTREGAVRDALERIGALEYFDVLVCGDMGFKSKPCPDIFLECAERMGIPPKSCYVLEDSPNGIRAAFDAGMMPVMIPDMIPPPDDITSKLYALKGTLYEAAELF